MPLPPLTPRTAVVGVVGAAWLGATIGLVDHVLTAPDPVTYFSGKVADPPAGAAPRAAAGVARLPQQLQHALAGGSTGDAKVLLIASPTPSAAASAAASPTVAAIRVSPTARATPTPSASAATSPSPTASPTPAASPDPTTSPTPAAVASYSEGG